MTSEDIKQNFSKNLIKLRKANNLTQATLAQKLNYSDKAVSKWEVGNVLPDVETMYNIAEFFGTTINDLITSEKKKAKRFFLRNHLVITLLSVFSVWLLASIVFLVLDTVTTIPRVWLIFIIAIPISCIILTIFTSIWFKKLYVTLSISALLWSTATLIYLLVNNYNLWFIYIVGIFGQLMIIFWSQLKKIVIPKHYKSNK